MLSPAVRWLLPVLLVRCRCRGSANFVSPPCVTSFLLPVFVGNGLSLPPPCLGGRPQPGQPVPRTPSWVSIVTFPAVTARLICLCLTPLPCQPSLAQRPPNKQVWGTGGRPGSGHHPGRHQVVTVGGSGARWPGGACPARPGGAGVGWVPTWLAAHM